MSTSTHIYRSFAVEAARQQGWVGFRTSLDTNGMWKARYEPGENPADDYAKAHPEWCNHGEVSWHGGGDNDAPSKVGVLVVKVPFEELKQHAQVAVDRTIAKVWIYPNDRLGHNPPHRPFLCEPLDAERWGIFTSGEPKPQRYDDREVHPGEEQAAKRTRYTTASPAREPSTAGSPTKKVWEIADGMPGASRADVIAKCLEAGINKNTAGTQYSHWKRARAGQ